MRPFSLAVKLGFKVGLMSAALLPPFRHLWVCDGEPSSREKLPNGPRSENGGYDSQPIRYH